jgi:integrase
MAVRKRSWTTRSGEPKTAWVVDYRLNGKRHIETFDRKKDADAREAQVRVNIKQGVHTAPSDTVTVAEAARQWLARVEAAGRERATLQQYRQHVRTHIAPRLGRVKLAKLTHQAVEKFRDDLLNGDDARPALSRATARKVLSSLKMLLKAAKFAHAAADVAIGRVSRERRLEPGRDFPEGSEVKRLIAAASDTPRSKALLLTAALTGLRASELRGLRWKDIDLKVGELHVRQRADRFLDIGAPKSKSATRTIPLAPELIGALKEWKLACPISEGELDLVFPTGMGRIEHHANTLRGLAPVMVAAGVVDRTTGKPKYALHAFRHFFASWCINPKERGGRELPPEVVQTLLGHSSIVMTLDVYGHLFRDGGDRTELAESSRLLLGDAR